MSDQTDLYRAAVVRFAGDLEVDGQRFHDNARLDVLLEGQWVHVRVPGQDAAHYTLPVHAVAGIHWAD